MFAEGTEENDDGPSNELAITITNLTFLKNILKPLSTLVGSRNSAAFVSLLKLNIEKPEILKYIHATRYERNFDDSLIDVPSPRLG